jgi:hypothetical protein
MALETGQDYYNYYSSMMPWGTQGTGTTNQGTGITQLSTPSMFYPQQGGDGGGGFRLPQNYYQAPTYQGIPGVPDQVGISATGLPKTNQAQNFWQNLNFPGKQVLGAIGNKIHMGLGTVAGLVGGALPKMSSASAANQRWAVDDAGFGTGTQRDQFGMLVGQSFLTPDRTYQDRLTERKAELEKFFAMGKKNSTFEKQLEHINRVLQIQEQERIAKEKEAVLTKEQWSKDYKDWQSSTGRDHEGTAGIRSPESKAGGAPGTASASRDWRSRGGILGAF